MTDRKEIEAVVEAILFVTSEPVSRQKIASLFPESAREEAEAAIETVLGKYRQSDDGGDGRGILLDEVAGGVRLVTRPELHGYLRKFFEISGSSKLSMAALEALAIVAYRQPITTPEIQLLRGRNSASVLKTLLERRLIRISGRKEVVGKPFLYATTREFLMHFGLQTIKDLPPLEDFEETFLDDGEAGIVEQLEIGDREEEILRAEAELDEGDSDAHGPVAAEDDEGGQPTATGAKDTSVLETELRGAADE